MAIFIEYKNEIIFNFYVIYCLYNREPVSATKQLKQIPDALMNWILYSFSTSNIWFKDDFRLIME